jgi:ribosome-associated translation inhibitor RaiA
MLKEIKELSGMPWFAEFMTAVIAVLTGVASVIATKLTKDKQHKADIAEIDLAQNKALKEVTDSLSRVEAELGVMSGTIQAISTERAIKKSIESLQKRIKGIGYTKSDLGTHNKAVESMILEGCEKAADFFGDILEEGFEHIDADKLQKKARSYLRGIRSQYSGDNHLTKDVVDEIKVKVAYPIVQELIYKLITLNRGQQIGNSREYFEAAAITFVEQFIDRAIVIINAHDSK